MTIGQILLILGIAEEVIAAIGDLIDINESFTTEQMDDIEDAMDAADDAWSDA